MIGDDLYKRRYGQPLLKCVTAEQAQYIIKELHEGICGYHSGARTMTTRVLKAGYFWPTIEAGCQASKIPNCSRRLFYQMDRSQAANHHHGPASPAIRVEEHYMQIWCTAYHYHRQ